MVKEVNCGRFSAVYLYSLNPLYLTFGSTKVSGEPSKLNGLYTCFSGRSLLCNL